MPTHRFTSPLAPSSARTRERALLLAVVSTAVSLIPTAYVALSSNSVILLADLLRCASEFLAIVVSWTIIRRIARSDCAEFNYGFGKLEHLAGLVVAFALILSCLVVVGVAIHRVIEPVPVDNAAPGLWFALLSVAGNGVMWGLYLRIASRAGSPVVTSQAALFRAKTLASGVVAASLLPHLFHGSSDLLILTDAMGAIVVAGLLLFSAIHLLSASTRELVDVAVDEAVQLAILRVLVHHVEEYHGFHGVRSRRVGGQVFAEVFLEFPPEMTMVNFAAISTRIVRSLAAAIPGGQFTIVPASAGDGRAEDRARGPTAASDEET